MRMLTPDEFPARLREIPNPPAQLYLEGTLPDLDALTVLTVVGTRRPTAYGEEACATLIAGLAGAPVAIVSGLALGMDGIAHRAALAAGLPTIALPGSGLDPSVLAPSSHRGLADEILAAGGALLSELPPTTSAKPFAFIARNRLMAGIAEAILVPEAGAQSGTLVTAKLGLDYNRDVLAVPGSIFSPASDGANWLLRQGATPITSVATLREALGLDTSTTGTEPHGSSPELFDSLLPSELRLVALLATPQSRDTLLREAGLPAGEVNALLMTLELKGILREVGGEIMLTAQP